MAILVTWEGRSYTPQDWVKDQEILRDRLKGKVEIAGFDSGEVFSEAGDHKITHHLRRGEMSKLTPDEVEDLNDPDLFGEWQKFNSIDEALAYVNELNGD
jgi:hypothetical protein